MKTILIFFIKKTLNIVLTPNKLDRISKLIKSKNNLNKSGIKTYNKYYESIISTEIVKDRYNINCNLKQSKFLLSMFTKGFLSEFELNQIKPYLIFETNKPKIKITKADYFFNYSDLIFSIFTFLMFLLLTFLAVNNSHVFYKIGKIQIAFLIIYTSFFYFSIHLYNSWKQFIVVEKIKYKFNKFKK